MYSCVKSWLKILNSKEILKYFKLNDNENTSLENLWDINKTVLWGKFNAVSASIRKGGKYKTTYLNFLLRKLRKEKQF